MSLKQREGREILLPAEIKFEILKMCRPADLAEMCQVSHRWLEQAAPLLYETVEVDEVQAGKLFCSRVRSSSMIFLAWAYL